ncbi:hypothetical protein [Bradyrhizobium sp. CB2312]|uniref:hypothetical protein n=1 Tax=Bradyrhizobium sp. CB2312 TaxID=3039155 RepID=UPI0024B22D3A|nr:hypothetical protein [Bradyrhizobium sp. CB2312]WFU76577.1 hypothetical protein QA642_22505 [Bradyrhizobium sp. CB2312]
MRGNLLTLIIFTVGLIAVDYGWGPILPDPVYCLVNAGQEIHLASNTRATSWSANDGCTAYNPRCATEYTTTPAQNICKHKTLWEGWREHLATKS